VRSGGAGSAARSGVPVSGPREGIARALRGLLEWGADPWVRGCTEEGGAPGVLGHGREGRRRWRAGPKRGEGRSGPVC